MQSRGALDTQEVGGLKPPVPTISFLVTA